MALCVVDEVSGEEAALEAHTFGGLKGGVEGVGLFNGHDAFGADLLECLSNELADFGIVCGDRCGCCDLLGGLDGLGVLVQLRNDGLDSCVNAALEGDGVRTGCNVTQAFANQSLSEDGCGGGAVTCDVISLLRNFLHQLGADALEGIFEVDFLSNGNAILGDDGGAPLLVENDVAALGAQGDLNGVGEEVQTALHAAACLLIEVNELCHVLLSFRDADWTDARDGRLRFLQSLTGLSAYHSALPSAKSKSGTLSLRVQDGRHEFTDKEKPRYQVPGRSSRDWIRTSNRPINSRMLCR